MEKIKLNTIEINFLREQLPTNLKGMISGSIDAEILISKDNADTLRDFFGEKLQEIGFDENDNPTNEGVILETLIDKFYF